MCIRPCGQDTNCSFSPISFKLHMSVVDEERRSPIDFGSQRKGQLWHFVYIKPCGHDTDYIFLPAHFQTSPKSCWWWDVEHYWFWVAGSKFKVTFGLCLKPCWHDTDCSFSPTTSNFTCKLWMIRGGILIDFGSGESKVKVNFSTLLMKPCGHDKDQSFCLITFKLHMQSCWWWEEESYWFLITGSKVKVKFGTLPVKPLGCDPEYSFCGITFKHHM